MMKKLLPRRGRIKIQMIKEDFHGKGRSFSEDI